MKKENMSANQSGCTGRILQGRPRVEPLGLKLIKQLGAACMGFVAPMWKTVKWTNAAWIGRMLSTLMQAYAYEMRSDPGH